MNDLPTLEECKAEYAELRDKFAAHYGKTHYRKSLEKWITKAALLKHRINKLETDAIAPVEECEHLADEVELCLT